MNSTLEMFLDEPVVEWSEQHKAALKVTWAKINKGTALHAYNKKFHTGLLSQRNNAALLYVVNAGIPHLSDFAREVAQARGIA
jgi:hypothetical protein